MKSFTFALAIALLSATAAFAQPSLKGDITVNTDIVTVGDMFDNPGELSETAIFRAHSPGTTGIVPLADIESAAHAIGLTDFENVGYTRVRVRRLTSVVDAPALASLSIAELSRRGVLASGVTAETHFDTAAISLNASQVETPATLRDLRYTAQTGQFSARFMIAGIDQPVDLSGNIQLMTKAPRLIDTYAAGTILTPADFELTDVPVSTAAAG